MSNLEIKLLFYSHGLTSSMALLRIFSLTKMTWAVLWKPTGFPRHSHKADVLSVCIHSWCPHSLIICLLFLKPVISYQISVKYHTIRDFCLVVGLVNYNPVNYSTWYRAFSLLLTTALQGGCHDVLSLLSCCWLEPIWCGILGFWDAYRYKHYTSDLPCFPQPYVRPWSVTCHGIYSEAKFCWTF